MKSTLFTFLLSISFISICISQPWLNYLPKNRSNNELTFYDFQKAFYDYWEPYNVENGYYFKDGVKTKAAGWKQFKRWEYQMQSTINPSTGEFPKRSAMEVYKEYLRKVQTNDRTVNTSDWTSLGPTTTTGGYNGIGRINCIAFHPIDTNTYWVGAASGGLWVTYNDGGSWTCLTDQNGILAISDIVIPSDYVVSNTIYIATGDKDHFDNRSIGVLKSTNSGASWNTTGLSFSISSPKMVNRLLLDPNNNNVIIAATTNGVYKSINGGVAWDNQISPLDFIDLEFKPNDYNTLYGAEKYTGNIYVSTNGGASWAKTYSNSNVIRIELAVSENENEWVYGVASKTDETLYGVLKSINSGSAFQRIYFNKNLLGRASNGNDSEGQGSYDLSITADKNNANIVLIGGINTWRSNNGGTGWSIVNHWTGDGAQAVHADKHNLIFRSNGDLFECNDGGIYLSKNNGTTWINKSNGLIISQMYKLGNSQSANLEILTGLQDNGTKLLVNSTWDDVYDGDGMECIIDPINTNIQFACSQKGKLGRTMDHWQSVENIQPSNAGEGNWVTPYILDPFNSSIIYAGYSNVWKSLNRGDSWTKISSINANYKLVSLAISTSNTNVIYAVENYKIWKTVIGGSTWTNVTSNLPVANGNITNITVSHNDPNTLWVTIGNYSNPGVYQSTNGGNTWTNISAGLPLLPAYSVVQNKLITNEVHLYAGTELGIYLKKGNDDWILYNNGLPNVKISELEIYYDGNTDLSMLRAATYGRGLWQSPLFYIPTVMNFVSSTTIQKNTNSVKPNNKNQEIIGIEIMMNGSLNPKKVNSFTFTTNGTTNKIQDISKVKLYHTGYNNLFDTINLIGSTINLLNDTLTINTNKILNNGKNYFWLAFDVSENAILGNFLDAECIAIFVDSAKIPIIISPPGSREINLIYCNAGATSTLYEYISEVILGNINQESSRGLDGYQDFTTQNDSIGRGDVLSFSIEVNQPYSGDQILIWLDKNRDGIFSNSNELIYYSNGENFTSPHQGIFSIPTNTFLGKTRLRIRLHDTDSSPNYASCGDSGYGEVEDYSLEIYQPPIAGVATSNSPLCYGDSLIINLNNYLGNIQWQKSTNGNIWEDIVDSGFNNSLLKTYLQTNSFFRAKVTKDKLPPVFSNIIAAIVNPIPAVKLHSTNGLNLCTNDITNLFTENEYFSYLWNTGDTISTISVSIPGNYYMSIIDINGCSSVSDTLQLIFNQNPTANLDYNSSLEFCQGNSLELIAVTNENNIEWSTFETTQSIIVNESGIYFVQVTDSNRCSDISDTISVIVNDLPTPIISSDEPTNFCAGDSITIVSTQAESYLWNIGDTTQNIIVNSSGEFFITVIDSNGCQGKSDTLIVIESDNPIANISTSRSPILCQGDSVILTADNAETYLWSNGATTKSITVNNEGNFKVTVTNTMNCVSISNIINVKVNPLPAVTIYHNDDEDTHLCAGEYLLLTSSESYTYLWNTGATSQTIIVDTIGFYSITVTDNKGCSNESNVININFHPILLPTIVASDSTTFCIGGNVILTSSPASSYLWNTGATTQSITATTTDVYKVTVIDNNGCSGVSLTQNVKVNPLPTASITPDGATTFCQGGSVTLNANNASAYLWSNNETTQNIVTTFSGNYNVTITDSNGCTDAASPENVTVHPLPTPTIDANGPTTFCSDNNVNLTSSPASSYLWSNGATAQFININESSEYKVTVTDGNSCTGESVPINVTVHNLPTASIVPSGATTFCSWKSVTLSSGTSANLYSWSNGASTPSIEVSTEGDYQLTITDSNGCTDASTIQSIKVNELPAVTIDTIGETTFCQGESVTLISSDASSYLWNTGAISKSLTLSSNGEYFLTITDTNGCSNVSIKTTVTVKPLPVSSITPAGVVHICDGKSVTLVSNVAASYQWSNGTATQTNIITSPGNYNVTITDSNGCSSSSAITEVIIDALPIATITASGSLSFCEGSSITLTSSNGNSYLWNNGATTKEIVVDASGDFKVTVTDANGCSNISNTTTTIEKPLLTPKIEITTSSTSVCEGEEVTFNSIVTNGGSNPNYQWFVNNVLQSETTGSFKSTSLTNGANVFCNMVSNEQCRTVPNDKSNTITMAVNPLKTPTIDILLLDDTIVECEAVSLEAYPSSEGSAPKFNWFVNDILSGTGKVFTSSEFNNNDIVYCKLQSNAKCLTQTDVVSDTLLLDVVPLPQPFITLNSDTISSTNYVGTNYDYSWYFNGNLVSNSSSLKCSEFGPGEYYLVIEINECQRTSLTLDIDNCAVATNDGVIADEIIIYPNPTKGKVIILTNNLNQNNSNIEVKNIYGQVLFKTTLQLSKNEPKTELDLGQYGNGVYFVKVGNVFVRRVVKVE